MHDSLSGDDDHPLPRKISVAAARSMLGMIGRNYSDEDLSEVLEALYGLAEAGFDVYRDTQTPPPDRPDQTD